MINTRDIPTNPGVYLFKDKQDHIIYIGKAKSLRSRVSSYFRNTTHSPKTQILIKNIRDVEFILVDNEVEALLLENSLIKKHKPKYNINLKDSKTYAYIKITDDPYPRIHSTRRVTKKGEYFGPYTDGTSRRQLIELCTKLFKTRTCRNLPKRACLNYHIGLCTAPCTAKVTSEQYQDQITKAREFLKGNTSQMLKDLQEQMQNAASNRKYEIALEKKNQITAIKHLHEKQKVDLLTKHNQDVIGVAQNSERLAITVFSIAKGVIGTKRDFVFPQQDQLLLEFIKMYYSRHTPPSEIIISKSCWQNEKDKEILQKYLSRLRGSNTTLHLPQIGTKARLASLAIKNATYQLENKLLRELQNKLNLPTLPRIIECFDMSNLSSTDLVGAMVQYIDGKPNKDAYRKFEIKQNPTNQDDFASMREVIYRRYARLQEENAPLPDLIIVDGGKGQLSSALTSLNRLGLHIPIFGLAKKEEEIFLPNEPNSRKFPKNSAMMLLVRQIRDSVHRFVISYNRKKRQMRVKQEMT